MSGVYNQTYFQNSETRKLPQGLLYIIVLVEKKSQKRVCVKIGITKGTSFKDAIKRSNGFTGYEIRIQKLIKDSIYNVWLLEQLLHDKFKDRQYTAPAKFGGHTELFLLETLPEILQEISSIKNST